MCDHGEKETPREGLKHGFRSFNVNEVLASVVADLTVEIRPGFNSLSRSHNTSILCIDEPGL